MKAFPSVRKVKVYAGKFGVIHEKEVFQEGMALRDYFAAKAMQALLSTTKDEQWFPDEVASIAYEMANAMINESEKQ